MRLCLTLALIFLWSATAQAGPWMREKGAVFLSFSHSRFESGDHRDNETKLYLEYGLSERFTLGLDAGQGEYYGDQSAIAFLRTPIGRSDGASRLAVEMGLGAFRDDLTPTATPEMTLRPGLSWGRGIDTRFGSGWITVETLAERRIGEDDTAYKADTTFGLNASDNTKLIMQFQSGDYPGSDPYLRLAPSLVREFAPGRHLELGLRHGLAGETTTGVKIGTWLSF